MIFRTLDPKKVGNDISSGYISPDGEFYPCDPTCHSMLSEYLLNIHYSCYRSLNPDNSLMNRGWYKVHNCRVIGTESVTDKQKETIYLIFTTKNVEKVKLNSDTIDINEILEGI